MTITTVASGEKDIFRIVSVVRQLADAAQTAAAALLKANNLSDLTNAGTARTNLGLGTSATHAVGDFALVANNLSDLANSVTAFTNIKQAASTSTSGVVTLATTAEATTGTDTAKATTCADVAAAVSANVQPAADTANIYTALNSLEYEIQKLATKALFVDFGQGNQFFDSYDTTTYIGSSTNQDTTTVPGSVRPTTATAPSAISGATGTAIGDLGTLANAFDGTTAQTSAGTIASASTPPNVARWIGKNYSSPSAIWQVIVFGTTNNGYVSGANPSVTIQLRGKNSAAPVGAGDGTLLGTVTFTDGVAANSKTILSNDKTTTWDYVWVTIQHNNGAAATLMLVEVVFYSPPSPNNMTLNSTLLTTTPKNITKALMVGEIEYTDAPTLNTDLIYSVSANNGTNYTTLTMAEIGTNTDPHKKTIACPITSLSNVGKQLKYRIATANNKMIQINSTQLVINYG